MLKVTYRERGARTGTQVCVALQPLFVTGVLFLTSLFFFDLKYVVIIIVFKYVQISHQEFALVLITSK